METKTSSKLVHVAKFQAQNGELAYLFLRKIDKNTFAWFQQSKDGKEDDMSVVAPSIEEAIRLANKKWAENAFRSLGCGFRYTLPERDEHGINALFHQMASSYNSSNGTYFDEELGNNCFVNFASQEALALWRKLKQENRL